MPGISSATREALHKKLLESVPELQTAFRTMEQDWEGEAVPDDLVFADLLGEHIVQLSEHLEEEQSASEIRRALELVEDLMKSSDEGVRNIAQVSVIEHILDCQNAFRAVRPLLGPQSLAAAESIWKKWKMPC